MDEELQTQIVAFPGKAKSLVWSHFGFYEDDGKVDRSHAVCRECFCKIKYTGNTTNLKSHLSKYHPDRIKELPTGPSRTQPTMDHFISHLSPKAPKAVELTNAVAEYIVKEIAPFNTVESDSFRHLLHVAEPRYKLPHRKTLTTNIIPKIYDDTRMKVKNELEKVKDLSVTTDCWTSVATQAYMTVTCHFMTKDWGIANVVLQTRQLPGQHTSEHLHEALRSAFEEWEIYPGFVLSDNASNIVKAVGFFDGGLMHVPCMAHTLNLAVKKGLKESNMVNTILARCRSIVSYFKRSSLACDILLQKQKLLGIPEHKLINDVETRWNSTYDMLCRILEQSVAIHATFNDPAIKKDSRNLVLEGAEQTFAENLVGLLRVMKEATLMLSDASNPSISLILPIISKLKRHLEVHHDDSIGIKTVKTEMMTNLSKRYQDVELRKVLVLATLIDVSYKNLRFAEPNELEEGKVKLHQLVLDLYRAEIDSIIPDSAGPGTDKFDPEVENSDCSEPKRQRNDNWFSDLLDDEDEQSPSEAAEAISIDREARAEVDRFLSVPRIDMASSTLHWFKKEGAKYPQISKLARKYLSVPATSVPSERVFSTAGLVITNRRSCLLPENVDKIIFLNKNYER